EEASEANNFTVYDYAGAYAKRGPNYFRLDGRISLKLNGKKLSQEWALDVQNITNHQNVFNQTYDQSSNEVVYNYQQGFFPMFLYRLNF
ncbi:MAG: TonB-dependent receptor, partial [Bacteroidales bacterium]